MDVSTQRRLHTNTNDLNCKEYHYHRYTPSRYNIPTTDNLYQNANKQKCQYYFLLIDFEIAFSYF